MKYCITVVSQENHERRTLLSAIVIIFIVAYAAIALEHPIKINKGASALLGAGLLWTVYAMLTGAHALVEPQLRESVGTTAGIVFFLIGAMTIVEVIDAHNGFEVCLPQHVRLVPGTDIDRHRLAEFGI
jgi:Na+/H+ antiporter NhaD/arsenite permease-like protein